MCRRFLTAVFLALATGETAPGFEAEPPRQLPGNKPCSFPSTAQKAAITGPVRFFAQITAEGVVESVDIRGTPWPGVGFEDAVRDCVAQWRFERATDGGTSPRTYVSMVRFRIVPTEESAIRHLLEQLAQAWNSRDEEGVERLEIMQGERPSLPSRGEHFLRKTMQAAEGSDRWLLELEPDMTYVRFLTGDVAQLRQPYVRPPKAKAVGPRQHALDLIVAKTPRGWRFISLGEPRKIKDVKPSYPAVARQVRIQGDVTLECLISPEGKVSVVRVLRGIPMLDEAAIEAVKQWLYAPILVDEQPVSVSISVTVNFTL